MERTNCDAPTTVAVVGQPLHCYACGYDCFWQRTPEHRPYYLLQLRLDQSFGHVLYLRPVRPYSLVPATRRRQQSYGSRDVGDKPMTDDGIL